MRCGLWALNAERLLHSERQVPQNQDQHGVPLNTQFTFIFRLRAPLSSKLTHTLRWQSELRLVLLVPISTPASLDGDGCLELRRLRLLLRLLSPLLAEEMLRGTGVLYRGHIRAMQSPVILERIPIL